MQVHAHKKMIRIYLLDYLENSLQPRLENQYLYPEEQAKYQQAYFEETEQQTLALAAGNEETEQEKEAVWSIAGRWQDGMEYAVHEEWQNEHGYACKQTSAPTWPEGICASRLRHRLGWRKAYVGRKSKEQKKN